MKPSGDLLLRKNFIHLKKKEKLKVQKSKGRPIPNRRSLGQESKLSDIAILLRIFPWFLSERKDDGHEEGHVNIELSNMSFSDRSIYLTQW